MATYNTDLATAQVSGLLKDRIREGAREIGSKKVAWAVYTTTGSEANGDVIQLTKLPIGAYVLPIIRITNDACGGTGAAIASIGDSGNAARYSATSAAIVTAASTATTPVAATFFGTPYKVTAATQFITATLALTSGNITAGKTISFLIEYIVEN